VETVDINYAPRASLSYLGIPFSLLSKPDLAIIEAPTGADSAATPSAAKRAKKLETSASAVIDLTEDD